MEYLSRSRLPVFTPRLDLTAEDLNAEAETLCAAINELAGRLFIIKDMIPKEERAQYAEEESYPILDEIERIWEDIQRAWETIENNKEECEAHYEETMARITELDERLNALIQAVKQELLDIIDAVDEKHDAEEERIENKFDISFADLEKRFNALDDAAARKADLATVFDRIKYIQDNSIPNVGADGYWYIGKIRTNTKAQGEPGEGVPKGGKRGQTLIKNSDKDYDTVWGTSAGGVTAVTVDDYEAGMEEETPILVVYIPPHVIDPTFEMENKLGATFNYNGLVFEVSATDPASNNANITVYNNSDKACAISSLRVQGFSNRGDLVVENWISFWGEYNDKLIEPGESSDCGYIYVPIECDYYAFPELEYITFYDDHSSEYESYPYTIPIMEGSYVDYKGLRWEITNVNGNMSTIKLKNIVPDTKVISTIDSSFLAVSKYGLMDNRLFLPSFELGYEQELEVSYQYSLQVNDGSTYADYLFIDNGFEVYTKIENPEAYGLLPQVGSTRTSGDFVHTINELNYENGIGNFIFKVESLRDIEIPPTEFRYIFRDDYGKEMYTLMGSTNQFEANGTQFISGTMDQDLTTATYIEIGYVHSIDPNIDLLPIEGSTITTPEGLKLKFNSHKYEDSTYTLYTDVTNTTDADIDVNDKLDLFDSQGNLIITLVCWVGTLGAGETSTAGSSCSLYCINSLYFIRYRKESE